MSDELNIERKAATEFAQKRDRIMGFVRSAKELQPLLQEMGGDAESDSEQFMIQLTEVLQKHNRSLEMLIDSFNLDQSVPSDSLLISLLGVELSKIERDLSFPEGAGPLIKEIASTLTQNTVKRKDLTEIQKDIAFQSDIVACVKTSLFKSAYEFHKILESLLATQQEKDSWMKWFHSTSVALGKDVAFNFDQRGTFRDREMLFRECLPICTELVTKTWKKKLFEAIAKKSKVSNITYISPDPGNLLSSMEKLVDVLEGQHMGYKKHKTTDLAWLKKQVSYSIYGVCESYDLSVFTATESKMIKDLVFSDLEGKAISAWKHASEKTIKEIKEKVEGMTHEEKIQWKKNEGSNPMPFYKFKEEFKNEWTDDRSILSLLEIKEEELTTSTRGALAQLWGYSDAFCRVKKETSR